MDAKTTTTRTFITGFNWWNLIFCLLFLITLIVAVLAFVNSTKVKENPAVTSQLTQLSEEQKRILKDMDDHKVNVLSKTNSVTSELSDLQSTFMEKMNTLQNHDNTVSSQLAALVDRNMVVESEMRQLLNSGRVSETGKVAFDNLNASGDRATTTISGGPIIQSKPVRFEKTYTSAPKVLLNVSGIDSASVKSRFLVTPINVTTTGFDAQLYYWWDTSLGGVTANYLVLQNV